MATFSISDFPRMYRNFALVGHRPLLLEKMYVGRDPFRGQEVRHDRSYSHL